MELCGVAMLSSALPNDFAGGYKRSAKVKDPFQLQLNAYRVLLTRGRDGTVRLVPPMAELDRPPGRYSLLPCKSGA